MGIPVRNRLDHTMIYVNPGDSAWDYDKIDAELRLIRIKRGDQEPEEGEELPPIPWDDEDEHPVKLYSSGKSRYDLATVRDYLLPDIEPTEFEIKRMALDDYGDVKDLLGRGQIGRARNKAIERGLVEVRGLPTPWKPKRNKATGYIRRDSLDELRELLTDQDFDLLGFACINASASLQDPEKKL